MRPCRPSVIGCVVLVAALALLVFSAPVSVGAQSDDDDDDGVEVPEGLDDISGAVNDDPVVRPSAPEAGGGLLMQIPAGCPAPQWPQAVFIGVLQASDDTTARFELQQVRAGSTDGYQVDDLVDVRYGIDTKYLEVGDQYLIGAGVDEDTGVLFSKVSQEQPFFYTREVVGVGDDQVECPTLEDPILTLSVTGRPIESGVFAPLEDSRLELVRAVAAPTLIAFAILVGLATVRWIGTGVFSGLRAVTVERGRARRNVS